MTDKWIEIKLCYMQDDSGQAGNIATSDSAEYYDVMVTEHNRDSGDIEVLIEHEGLDLAGAHTIAKKLAKTYSTRYEVINDD